MALPELARLQPPYYQVSFHSMLRDDGGYSSMAEHMLDLAAAQPGYLGAASVRDSTGVGITLSYWQSLEAIQNWRDQLEHQQAQRIGRERWYQWYRVEISKVERGYHYTVDDIV